MSAFDIALAIQNDHDSDKEELQAFLLRRFAKEKMSAVAEAIDLLTGQQRAYDDFEALLNLLRPVTRKQGDATIDVLTERKRRLGYDPAFESLMARTWRCPHCQRTTTISNVEMPVGDPKRWPRCTTCGGEGIAPIDGEPQLAVRDGGKSGLRPISAGERHD